MKLQVSVKTGTTNGQRNLAFYLSWLPSLPTQFPKIRIEFDADGKSSRLNFFWEVGALRLSHCDRRTTGVWDRLPLSPLRPVCSLLLFVPFLHLFRQPVFHVSLHFLFRLLFWRCELLPEG